MSRHFRTHVLFNAMCVESKCPDCFNDFKLFLLATSIQLKKF